MRKLKIKKLTILFLAIIFMEACGGVRLEPPKLKIMDIDRETTKFPPSIGELAAVPNSLLPLASKGEGMTTSRFNSILRFIYARLEKYGRLEIVSSKLPGNNFSDNMTRKFYSSNPAEGIELAKSLKVFFMSQIYADIVEDKTQTGGNDYFKARIKLTTFRTDSGQMVFSRDVFFDSRKPGKSVADLKKLAERYFPVRGFILETRGGRQAAKISVGRASGIVLGRKFQVAERRIRNERTEGKNRRIVADFPTSVVAEVIKVMENDAWVQIKKSDRDKVRQGQPVFSLPE